MTTTGYGYCQCGCGERTKIAPRTRSYAGCVKGQPLRYIRGHACRKSPVLYVEEDCGYATPCWTWQGAKTSGGYGSLRDGGPTRRAHRVYYERHVGPIPDGLQLDHLCRNRLCVNPAHLEPVTNAENGRRGKNAKLTAEQVCEIRRSGASASAVAERYGVSSNTVWRIRRRKMWVDL